MTYTMSIGASPLTTGAALTPPQEPVMTLMDESRYRDICVEFAKAGRIDVDSVRSALVDRYVKFAMRRAVVEDLGGEGLYAEIPGIAGVWADGDTSDEVYADLEGTLRAWLDLKIDNCDGDIPTLDQVNLNVLC